MMDVSDVTSAGFNTGRTGVRKTEDSVDSGVSVDKQAGKTAQQAVKEHVDEVTENQRRAEDSAALFDESINQANKVLEQYHRRIDRSVHEKTNAMMYKIVDTDKNEVIREFPSRKIQDMISKMWELAGLFVDEQA
ncbi:MAG: flagellar protein FlaG [Fibrobacterota bacterium]